MHFAISLIWKSNLCYLTRKKLTTLYIFCKRYVFVEYIKTNISISLAVKSFEIDGVFIFGECIHVIYYCTSICHSNEFK